MCPAPVSTTVVQAATIGCRSSRASSSAAIHPVIGIIHAQMEEELHGGNTGRVVRVGETVRREAGPWTPTIHGLLAHVRERGVDWAPEPLGVDAEGREIVGFIDGEVPNYPLPEWVWDEGVLVEAARRLRQLHDATAGFTREDRTGRLPAH